jgi:hypothetical protein
MLLARLPRLGLLADERVGQEVELAMRLLELAIDQAKPLDQRTDVSNRGLCRSGSDRDRCPPKDFESLLRIPVIVIGYSGRR